MGVGPSLGDFLRATDDEGLAQLVEEAYRLSPERLEKAFAHARQRCNAASEAAADAFAGSAAPPLASARPAPATQPPVGATAYESSRLAASVEPRTRMIEAQTVGGESTPIGGGKDPMNALWDFDGHRLRELQPASANPSHAAQQSAALPKDSGAGAPNAADACDVDEDGHAVLFGSCGRDKRYARCAVCYFRGLRCNTGHYCACCQRPVCIRPRKYPGEEHPKICWNVLHMDKDMLQRVEKKKRRRLQVSSGSSSAGVRLSHASMASAMASSSARSLESDHTSQDRREMMAATVSSAPEGHEQAGVVALDTDTRPPLADSLSTTSVAL